MGRYSVGVATKTRIIDSCKELFYQKGLEETTYDDICKSADINRGLLSYYFKSKDNIAGVIFTEFMTELDGLIAKKFPEAEYNVSFVINSILLFRLLKSNSGFLKFYYSIETKESFSGEIRTMQERFIHGIVESQKLAIDEDELKTLISMFVGVETQMVRDLYNGFLTEPIDRIISRDIFFVYDMLGIEKAVIQDIFSQAEEQASKYRLTVNSRFEVKLQKQTAAAVK